MCLTFSAATPNSSAAETPCACAVRRIGRHDIGDVAHDEQFARPRVENHLGRDARVAAADHHDFRRLAAFGELLVAALLLAQAAAEKGGVAFDEAGRGNVIVCTHRVTPGGVAAFIHAQIAIGNP